MRKYLLVISVLILNQLAVAGSEGVGGGDPDAVDFLLTAKTFNQWVLKSDIGLTNKEKNRIDSTYRQLAAGMNHQSLTPIRFISQPIADLSGAPKVALYSKKPFSITINRKQWKNLNPQEKFIIVSLEIFGLSDVDDRYDVAGKIKLSISTLSEIKSDLQLLNFVMGAWTLADGACLSGRPVHWGNTQNNFENYHFNLVLESNLSFSFELRFNEPILAKSKGNFRVKDANLILTTTESCRLDSGEPCDNRTTETNGLLSIQNDQLWIMYNQGNLGGSCGPQDVFIMKFRKK